MPLFVNNKIAFNKSIRYLQKVHDYNEAARVMKEMLLIQICCIAGVVVDRVTYNLIVNSKYLKLLHGQNDDDHPVSVPYYFSRWDSDCSIIAARPSFFGFKSGLYEKTLRSRKDRDQG